MIKYLQKQRRNYIFTISFLTGSLFADSLPRKEYSIYTGFEDLQKHPSERPSYVKMFSHWNQNNAMKIGETSFSESHHFIFYDRKTNKCLPVIVVYPCNQS
ncbi:uncharacterized protein OCT59_019361 [Rhizophagus irregularis]|uniref:uncharacterized protein n=1 Tax=Rhizophagus irregularis TaxID=588596 RepID=UPI0033266622|nr:hypothetical protein OCT59_019361 [Rhizophagus irregularis]